MSRIAASLQHQRTAHPCCCCLPLPRRGPRTFLTMKPDPGESVAPAAAEPHGHRHVEEADSGRASNEQGLSRLNDRDHAAGPADAGTQQSTEAASHPNNGDSEAADEDEADQEVLAMLLGQLQGLHVNEDAGVAASQVATTLDAELLPSFDLAGIAALIASGKARRIICMVGAGISVSAGIPDFRTPGTGLYSQLERYNLPRPEAVFSLDFFRAQPEPFFMLAKELFPGKYVPTPTHLFMKLLHSKGLLLRCYTQNIDSLECQAGLPPDHVVAAHGNFDGAHCIDCRRAHSTSYVEEAVLQGRVCYCNCGGLVKPDIVFFGESLPARFFTQQSADFPACDLLMVMGTSLVVQPFAGLVDRVPHTTPRVLLNRERVGVSHAAELIERLLGLSSGGRSRGFDFRGGPGCRDVCVLGDADDSVRELANLLGWREELEDLLAQAHRNATCWEGSAASSGGDSPPSSAGADNSTSVVAEQQHAVAGASSAHGVPQEGSGSAGAAHKAVAAAAAVGEVVEAHTSMQQQSHHDNRHHPGRDSNL